MIPPGNSKLPQGEGGTFAHKDCFLMYYEADVPVYCNFIMVRDCTNRNIQEKLVFNLCPVSCMNNTASLLKAMGGCQF